MKIPRHWARARASRVIAGEAMEIVCFGWSFTDAVGAEAKAGERAAQVLDAIEAGRDRIRAAYLYSDRPVKEEILSEKEFGDIRVLVTRTRYGSLILNADKAMFIDIDAPDFTSGIGELIKSLFGKRIDRRALWLETVESRLASLCAEHKLTIRLYRTAKGLRGLVTNRTFSATDPLAKQILSAAQSDPLFIRLCKAQECFRARLTPKPFRCDCPAPPHAWPFADARQEAAHQAWLAKYASAIQGRDTCAFVAELGKEKALPSLAELVKFHDAATRPSGTGELA